MKGPFRFHAPLRCLAGQNKNALILFNTLMVFCVYFFVGSNICLTMTFSLFKHLYTQGCASGSQMLVTLSDCKLRDLLKRYGRTAHLIEE